MESTEKRRPLPPQTVFIFFCFGFRLKPDPTSLASNHAPMLVCFPKDSLTARFSALARVFRRINPIYGLFFLLAQPLPGQIPDERNESSSHPCLWIHKIHKYFFFLPFFLSFSLSLFHFLFLFLSLSLSLSLLCLLALLFLFNHFFLACVFSFQFSYISLVVFRASVAAPLLLLLRS